jgi:acetylornithine deacetylase/succinyl-diaminopimelate desuccinylase-like protein
VDTATPAITTRLRGSTYVEVKPAWPPETSIRLFGGSAQNAANILAKALGQLHDEEGRIQIPGFYDSVKPLSRELLASWEALNFDEAAFLGRMGLRTPAGEKGREALDRLWARPTADTQGCGAATPALARRPSFPPRRVQVSFRLVPGQDPSAVVEAFRRFILERLPSEGQASFNVMFKGKGLRSVGQPMDTPRQRLSYGRAPILRAAARPSPSLRC